MSSSKLKDAINHMKEAEKALKTSLFKWTPDYDTAASEYTKAATSFKICSSLEQAKECYIKASDMQEKLSSLFHSAKKNFRLLTQAAGVSIELKQLNQAVELMEKACSLYQQHGTPDTAALTLVKAGKMCEATMPDKAVEFFIKASELCENDGKLRDASDYINQAVRIQVKHKRYIESTKLMKKRLELIQELKSPNMAYNVILSMVIVFLTERDFVAANKSFLEGFNIEDFSVSDEAKFSERLIKSFEDGDEEMLLTTKNQPTVTNLDVEISRLARMLKIPKDRTSINVENINESSEMGSEEENIEGVLC